MEKYHKVLKNEEFSKNSIIATLYTLFNACTKKVEYEVNLGYISENLGSFYNEQKIYKNRKNALKYIEKNLY